MMILFALLLAFMAPPFWETTPPPDWTDEQLHQLLHISPWAQVHGDSAQAAKTRGTGAGRTASQAIQMYLASAKPMAEAEAELRRRNPLEGAALEDPVAEEYREFMHDNPGKYIVLAIRLSSPGLSAKEKEITKMENDCVLKVGKQKHELVGHFPPTPADPYLRLVFPRVVKPTEKQILFNLYLPGVWRPFRRVRFDLKQTYYKGKLEL